MKQDHFQLCNSTHGTSQILRSLFIAAVPRKLRWKAEVNQLDVLSWTRGPFGAGEPRCLPIDFWGGWPTDPRWSGSVQNQQKHVKTAVPPGCEISINHNLYKYNYIYIYICWWFQPFWKIWKSMGRIIPLNVPNLPGTEEATAFCRALESCHFQVRRGRSGAPKLTKHHDTWVIKCPHWTSPNH